MCKIEKKNTHNEHHNNLYLNNIIVPTTDNIYENA
jgi:hypothetical protein